jgi:thiol:disulfide interchange protein DsbD
MLKKVIILLSALSLLSVGVIGCELTGAGTDYSGPMEWLNGWTEALEQAQAQNKPILINFYTDICPACRKLDQKTYTDEELSSFLNANFINLRSNAGKSTLFRRYGVGAVPTIVFNAPDGYDKKYEISRFTGYRDAEAFYQEAQAALDKWQS